MCLNEQQTIHRWCGSSWRQQLSRTSCLTLKGASSAYKVILVCALYKETLYVCIYTSTQSYTLTILVLTSFSMALTSSAALGTSEDDCIDVSKAADWEGKRRIKSKRMLERLAEKAGRGGEKSYNENARTNKLRAEDSSRWELKKPTEKFGRKTVENIKSQINTAWVLSDVSGH